MSIKIFKLNASVQHRFAKKGKKIIIRRMCMSRYASNKIKVNFSTNCIRMQNLNINLVAHDLENVGNEETKKKRILNFDYVEIRFSLFLY